MINAFSYAYCLLECHFGKLPVYSVTIFFLGVLWFSYWFVDNICEFFLYSICKLILNYVWHIHLPIFWFVFFLKVSFDKLNLSMIKSTTFSLWVIYSGLRNICIIPSHKDIYLNLIIQVFFFLTFTFRSEIPLGLIFIKDTEQVYCFACINIQLISFICPKHGLLPLHFSIIQMTSDLSILFNCLLLYFCQ